MKHIFFFEYSISLNQILLYYQHYFFMTELHESSLTARREALAKHKPAYFARAKRISVRTILLTDCFI